MKKLSEQNPSEPHSLAVFFKVYLEGALAIFMGRILHYIYVFVCGHCLAKTYCFLPSIGQLAMPSLFLSNKYLQCYQQKYKETT